MRFWLSQVNINHTHNHTIVCFFFIRPGPEIAYHYGGIMACKSLFKLHCKTAGPKCPALWLGLSRRNVRWPNRWQLLRHMLYMLYMFPTHYMNHMNRPWFSLYIYSLVCVYRKLSEIKWFWLLRTDDNCITECKRAVWFYPELEIDLDFPVMDKWNTDVFCNNIYCTNNYDASSKTVSSCVRQINVLSIYIYRQLVTYMRKPLAFFLLTPALLISSFTCIVYFHHFTLISISGQS